ncbi:unnamed protein product [Rhizophagus irregularis]|nr:unnamed protein product [Rhizophagus irregularis]
MGIKLMVSLELFERPRQIPLFLLEVSEKIEKFKKFERESQQRIVKSRIKYATGVIPGRSRVVTFSQFLPIVLKENSEVSRGRGRGRGRGKGRGKGKDPV